MSSPSRSRSRSVCSSESSGRESPRVVGPSHGYNFRLFDESQRPPFLQVIDKDESGDFSPSEEAPRKRAQSAKKRPAAAGLASSPEKKPRVGATGAEGSAEPNFTELSARYIQPSRLRRRDRAAASDKGPDDSDKAAHRGCVGCSRLGLECDLDHGGQYPCQHCRESEEECELLSEPALKRPCTTCTRRRIVCSFRDAPKTRGACTQCQARGFECVAGPQTRTPRPSRQLHEQREPIRNPRLTIGVCTECQKAGAHCSLRDGHGFQDCRRCQTFGLKCVQGDPDRPEPGNVEGRPSKSAPNVLPALPTASGRSPLASSTVAPSIQKSSPPAEAAQQTEQPGHGGGRERVLYNNRISQPVLLTYDPVDGEPNRCQWCGNLHFALVGIPKRIVHVFDPEDGQGYVELEGESAGAFGETPMCGDCRMERLSILTCSKHRIRQIPGTDPSTHDHGCEIDYLEDGTAAEAPFKWCSVCLSAAFYECTCDGGCGLVLCGLCESHMRTYAGSLTRVITRQEEDDDDGTYIRADAWLLKEEEQLHRWLINESNPS